MEHRIIRAKTQLPVRDLIEIPYSDRTITATLEPFGSQTYKTNVQSMSQPHAHPESYTPVTFRPATTNESVAIASYMFGDKKTFKLKENVFNPNWLQAGRIVRTQAGVWTNPTGQFDEVAMKRLLTEDRKVNGIYLLDRNTAFAPYESFKTEAQSHEDFLQSGLARAIEHIPKQKAVALEAIANSEVYPNGVFVWGFDSVSKPTEKVLRLNSGRDIDDGRLIVNGDYWDDYNNGSAFGVLDVSTPQSANDAQNF